MENISYSLPKRSFSSISNAGFISHKSVYDDVFGGAPKFGLPTLAPRLEDYSEIFGGFHAARSSSIPVLDLPLIGGDSDLHFDVRSADFDYSEVFGDFGSLDFTPSFEDLVGQSSGGYASSDEPWSPAQSGSLSDELDALAGSAKSRRLSDGDLHQTLESTKQFNVSYNKSSQRNIEKVLAGTSHVTNFSAVPEYTFSHYDSPVSWNGEDEHCSVRVIDDINHSKEFDERVIEDKNYKKCSSNPLHGDFNAHGSDFYPLEKHGNSTPQDKPFITVSDISLQTKPSRLPPPSRPPPALVVKKGEFDKSNSKLRASNSYAFERVADDSAPLFFDVEVDATLSAEGRENGNKNVKVKHESTKESIERKDIRFHNAMQVQEKSCKTVRVSSGIEDEKMLLSQGKGTRVSAEPAIECRIGSTKSTKETSGSPQLQYGNHMADNSARAVAWKEAAEYYEVIEQNISKQGFDMVGDFNTLAQHMKQDAYTHWRTTDASTFDQKEDSKKCKATIKVPTWDEDWNQPEMTRDHFDPVNKQQKEIPITRFSDQQGFHKKVMLNKLACDYNLNQMIPEHFLQFGESEKIQNDYSETVEGWPEAKGEVTEMGDELKLKASPTRKDIEERSLDDQPTQQNGGKRNQNILREEGYEKHEDSWVAETRDSVMARTEPELINKQHNEASGRENENKPKETHELNENRMTLKLTKSHGDSGTKSYIGAGHEKSGNERLASDIEKDKDRLMEVGEQTVIDSTVSEALEQVRNGKEHKLVCEREVMKERNEDASRTDDNDLSCRMAMTEASNQEEVFDMKQNVNLSRNAVPMGEMSGHAEELGPIERNDHESEIKWDLDSHVLIEGEQLKVFDGGCKLDELTATKVLGRHHNIQMLELNQAAFSSDGNGELKSQLSSGIYESEAGTGDILVKGKLNSFSKNKDELQDLNNHSLTNNMEESPSLPNQVTDSNTCSSGVGFPCVKTDKISPLEYSHQPEKIMSAEDDRRQKMKGTQFISKRVDRSTPSQVIRESVTNGRKAEDASSVFEYSDYTRSSVKNATSQKAERKDKIMTANDQKVGERIRREAELENEHLSKIEEEREREREREKDRMAVDRAALEARERSYAEARERVERAAVERATAEVRQRAIAGARERLEKASMEARLRAERAAVERATAEARQRAAQKAASAAHDLVERSAPDRFSASFRYADTRQSSLSSDLHFQSTGISNGLRYSYSSALVGAEGESPQRCKARLERYRRTAERAANALAEKNRRDLLAQREREERNRVAEVLDAEVKRWSSGKEGNLRALLSTLQYILGSDSGWQPIPLTEVITSVAVRKAYRKATLCVHPDKLQQRGATIQQKYICEKVFDLLKEAWNKFNSEER